MYLNIRFIESVYIKFYYCFQESVLEHKLQDLAGHVGPLYKKCAPSGHANQVCYFNHLRT